MPADALLNAMVPLVADLGHELPDAERYRRLLDALRSVLPCDAAALLRLEGDTLVPLAIDGLSPDTLGRRFRVDQHPRFAALLAQPGPTRFPADSPLPDPYDGLVAGTGAQLAVHDCLGCPIHVDDRLWGLLTLDSLEPGRFDDAWMKQLAAFVSLAAATVRVARRFDEMSTRLAEERARNAAWRDSAPAPRVLLGQGTAYRRLVDEIGMVAASDLTVLITGETGVGKELVAQAIHAGSPRAGRPMVTVNCAALPDMLVESELFGHVRGAFSGAVADRRGKFEVADGGTLFLDEVGELPLPVQAKLLRALQSGQLQRLGSDREHRVDVRLISATNRDLARAVASGDFRADLYHRLGAYPLRVPPLRERGHDVLLLAGGFLEEQRARLGLASLRIAADAQAALLAHDWPGNVRELEHVLGRAALRSLARQPRRPRILTIAERDLDLRAGRAVPPPADTPAMPAPPRGLRDAVDDFQRRFVAQQLERHQGNWSATARALDVDAANLARLARRLGLR